MGFTDIPGIQSYRSRNREERAKNERKTDVLYSYYIYIHELNNRNKNVTRLNLRGGACSLSCMVVVV